MEDEEPKQISLPLFFLPKIIFMLVVLAAIFILSSCHPQPNFGIRGDWNYIMTEENDNTYTGTIRFDGNTIKGTYPQVNIYEIEYEGEYVIKKNNITLGEDESWDGVFANENNISGTWQQDAEAKGSFEAIRK
jgi:hypothetical protein